MGPRLRPWLPSLAVALVALTPASAVSQVPAGSEFRANTHTTGAQLAPAVAREPDGDFVVVWHSRQDGNSYDIFGQRYDANGTPRGAEFQVNTYTTATQYFPWVAADARGHFVVVWTSAGVSPDGSGDAVLGQRFAADGSRLGSEFIVNTYTTGDQRRARVSASPAGDFVVVWESVQDGSDTSIHAQRYERTGRRVGSELQVNEATTGFQLLPDVMLVQHGPFTVVWDNEYDVSFRIFNADNTPFGPEVRVNTYTTGIQTAPAIGVPQSGLAANFVIAWLSGGLDGYDLFARRINAFGVPLGAEFQVNTYTSTPNPMLLGNRPVAASDDRGNFVISWLTQDGSGTAAMARRYSYSGTPRSPEFVVNTYTGGTQDMAHVAGDPVGNFAVAWRSNDQDGSGSGVFGQRFGGLHPRTLEVDTVPGQGQNGNRVLEPGESVDVRPAWENVNGAALAFTGTLQRLPVGCGETMGDGAGSYGTVPNGVTAPCTDCYVISAASSPRCTLHWDAWVLESLSPDNLGQVKRWFLHVGDSFADVPRTNAFYRFVETLLHHNITGGCSGTQYCPVASTTREQMTVFVLGAKEGGSPGSVVPWIPYQPPACVPPNIFDDVPETSPFCRWIEELASRGVVTGCGGGNYCPSNAVTREQMPVFVLRALDPALNPAACAPPNMFSDVPEASPFCRWIEELARRGVVTGCGPNLYCPAEPVTREQMAVFISATFGLSLYGP